MGGEENYSEKGSNPRKPCFVAVELYLEGPFPCILGRLIDISRTGCSVETPTPVDVGVWLRINPLGYARELSVAGKVVNQGVIPGIWFHTQGIEFSTTADDCALARFIEFLGC